MVMLLIDRVEIKAGLMPMDVEADIAKGLLTKAGKQAFSAEKAKLEKSIAAMLSYWAKYSDPLEGVILEAFPPSSKVARGYRAAFRVSPADVSLAGCSDTILRIGHRGGPSGSVHSLKAEWNPARAGAAGAIYLQLLLTLAAIEKPTPFHAALSCTLSRLDIAIDRPLPIPATLTFDHATKSTGALYKSKKHGLEAVHFGANGCDAVHIYNRRFAKWPSDAFRLEFRLVPKHPKSIRLLELPKLSNPLPNLRVYDTGALGLSAAHAYHLARAIDADGLEHALAAWADPVVIKMHRQKILASTPAWWDPAALWSKWPDLSAEFMAPVMAMAALLPPGQGMKELESCALEFTAA